MRVTNESRNVLHDRLVAAGVPTKIAGDVSADLGDMTGGLEDPGPLLPDRRRSQRRGSARQ